MSETLYQLWILWLLHLVMEGRNLRKYLSAFGMHITNGFNGVEMTLTRID